eukprot:scaffold4855_cov115-Isochrysis_galbana.AAC.4
MSQPTRASPRAAPPSLMPPSLPLSSRDRSGPPLALAASLTQLFFAKRVRVRSIVAATDWLSRSDRSASADAGRRSDRLP